MNKFKNKLLGTVAIFLLLAGFSHAADLMDPTAAKAVSKPEIKEFASFCNNGSDPR
jgi:hypothetical protein